MSLQGAEGMSWGEVVAALEGGARVVTFDYTISVCVLTFSQSSEPFFLRAGQGAFFKGLPYTLLSLLLGWWALPFGPFFTVATVFSNMTGGNDRTRTLLARAQGGPATSPPPAAKGQWKAFLAEKRAERPDA